MAAARGIPEAPAPRSQHSATPDLAANRIWIFGGAATDGTYLNDLHAWDASQMCWSGPVATTGLPPAPRGGHVAALHANTLWVFAGTAAALSPSLARPRLLNDVHALDLATLQWRSVSPRGAAPPPPPPPPPRAFAAAALLPSLGALVVTGGAAAASPRALRDAWLLDLRPQSCGAWRQLAPLPADLSTGAPSPRAYHTLAASADDSHVMALGGVTADAEAAAAAAVAAAPYVESLAIGDGGDTTWLQRDATAAAPACASAALEVLAPASSLQRYAAAAAQAGDLLYEFGGYVAAGGAGGVLGDASLRVRRLVRQGPEAPLCAHLVEVIAAA
ncbi:hypothetical protein JKP88DRAFT_240623 [Tribonema minus]|uniref:Uncharacterized protein n=1 Tax=Tribonema minus TaxID=303371 RepID=A0A836CNF1_9STRA|nr:hypothetical protein JKP88DRAFT_240623 [Tribonema minus]